MSAALRDPAARMTAPDLLFIATLDRVLEDRAYGLVEPPEARRPCPGCSERCSQCDDEATD